MQGESWRGDFLQVNLAYGQRGLNVDLPEGTIIIEPKIQPALSGQVEAVARAIANPVGTEPVGELARGKTVCIVTSDLTRPVPNRPILEALLPALEEAGARRIKILIATGLHRPNTREELCQMFGEDLASKYEIINHRATSGEELTLVGTLSDGTPLWVNRHYLEAECKILTGFIEPHFFAGFSGGRKAILPGIVGEETIRRNHSAHHLNNPLATFGQLGGNPIHQQMLEGAQMVGVDFIINVATNRQHQITGVFAGELEAAHSQGVDFVRKNAMFPLDAPCDLVVTTNSGYPLDLNLYQAVKGLSAAAQVTKPGGTIILVAQCREGIGEGAFAELLKGSKSPQEILEQIATPGFYRADQWTAQILARILTQMRVYLYSEFIPNHEIAQCHLLPTGDPEATVAEIVGDKKMRIAVLPQGPMVIPYLTKEREQNETTGV